jgi:hypothetical protein
MFIKSAASDTDQGKAIQSINEKWGDTGNSGRPWGGRETIGIQVCKKKYTPFVFNIETSDEIENEAKNSNAAGHNKSRKRKVVKVVRMFGCPHHSDIRRERIECHGVRNGWEPFGQWSLRKAQQLARRETIRLNSIENGGSNGDDVNAKVAALPDYKTGIVNNSAFVGKPNKSPSIEDIKTVCHNGKCLWKKRDKYDDIHTELTGNTESSGDDDVPQFSASS